jgi:hypothetical protein
MKKNIYWSLSWVAIVILFAACTRGGDPVEEPIHQFLNDDTTDPVIQITTPADNQVFTSGANINVTGKVTDNSLYQGSIKIINNANNAVLKEQLYEIHGLQLYNFNLAYAATVAAQSNYSVIVTFDDHGGHTSADTVKVKVNP